VLFDINPPGAWFFDRTGGLLNIDPAMLRYLLQALRMTALKPGYQGRIIRVCRRGFVVSLLGVVNRDWSFRAAERLSAMRQNWRAKWRRVDLSRQSRELYYGRHTFRERQRIELLVFYQSVSAGFTVQRLTARMHYRRASRSAGGYSGQVRSRTCEIPC